MSKSTTAVKDRGPESQLAEMVHEHTALLEDRQRKAALSSLVFLALLVWFVMGTALALSLPSSMGRWDQVLFTVASSVIPLCGMFKMLTSR